MKGLAGKVSQEDMENARQNRMSKTDPAQYDPGMEDGMDTLEEFTSSGTDYGSASGAGGWGAGFTDPSSPLGTGAFGGDYWASLGQTGMLGGQPEQPAEPDFEEKAGQVLFAFGKGAFGFFKEFVKSFPEATKTIWCHMGKTLLSSGVIAIIVGGIIRVFGKGIGYSIMIAGGFSIAVGVGLFMFFYDDMKREQEEAPEDSTPMFVDNPGTDYMSDATDMGEDLDEDTGEDTGEDDGEDLEDDDFDPDSVAPDPDIWEKSEDFDKPLEFGNALSATEGIDRRMVTRQYLFDVYQGVLRNSTPNFYKSIVIPDDDQEKDRWDAIVQKSAEALKNGQQDDIPYVITVKEKLFYILLEVHRVNWIKNVDALVSEIVNVCQYDSETGALDKSIYGIGLAVGDKFIIKIIKGETAEISLKDAYGQIKEHVLDPSVYMPVVIGVDSEGQVVWRDFKSINSVLITGMPRSGKSWCVQSILTQMMMYLKPSELNIYILDPKRQISDFKAFHMPHIKKFITEDDEMLKELRYIVRVEGKRRNEVIGKAGFVNIWDYKKVYPDANMPLLYVVIDEVVTLSDRMEPEIKKEFQGLLRELVSQLPALGIRVFMIPHVIKDQILSKTTTDLIPCRVSVMGDAKHIENVTGEKKFPQQLTHIGDMAVKLDNGETGFVHGAILTNSNTENDALFDFIARMWAKLEPESCPGSRYDVLEHGDTVDKLLSHADDSDKTSELNVWG